MRKRIVFLILTTIGGLSLTGQEKWDLKRCVEYAWANNITIKLQDVQAGLSDIQYKEAQWSKYPQVNFSTNLGLQSGRSIDPTTNLFTTTQLLGQGYSLQAGAMIFNWNRIRNNILAAKYSSEAAIQDVETSKNDIGLSVANYYLQVLLTREQANIARVQMQQTMTQLQATRKRVEAGSVPELNALTLESQYATDSSNYISAKTTAEQTLLSLKVLLNLDPALDFDIATPPVDIIPVEPIAELQPETVYSLALENQPAQKANELRLKSMAASIKASKAQFYPSVSVFGSAGTNFAASNKKITGFSFLGYESAGQYGPVTDVNGTYYPVLSPNIKYSQANKSFGEIWKGYGTQLSNNFRQSIGITISVPILNGGSARFGYQRSKLMYQNAEWTKVQANQTLKNNIYNAYYLAVAALEKYNASRLAVTSNQRTYDFSVKRYDLGLLSTVELIIAQSNLTRARLDMSYAHFDFVFKMKVLEYYKGMGIRLQ